MATPKFFKIAASVFAFWCVAGAGIAQELPPVRYTNGIPQCPSDNDLRNLDVRLSAVIHTPRNADSVRKEIHRAQTCRRVGTTYSAADWKRMEAVVRGEQ